MRASPNIEKLVPSATIAVSTLAGRLRAEGRDVINLSAGEPDFDTPDWIREAGIASIQDGGTRYTPAAGLPELRTSAARYLAGPGFPDPDPSGLVVTAGAKQALFNACFALFGPGDRVLISAPYWTSYPQMVVLARAEPVAVAGREERDFRLTADDLEEAARAGDGPVRGLLLCSPNNPTGTVYPLSELREVAAWARERNVVLLSDEIYRRIHFSDDGEPAPGLLHLSPEDRGPFVIVDGVSKTFAMTGWRIGFALTDPEVASRMAAIQSHTTSNAATPSQHAALAAISDPGRAAAAVREMTSIFRRRRDLVVSFLEERLPELSFVEPLGAFYLFVRIDGAFGPGEGSTAWCSRLLAETGVALVPGAAFGDDRYARLSFATSDALLGEAMSRLAGFLP